MIGLFDSSHPSIRWKLLNWQRVVAGHNAVARPGKFDHPRLRAMLAG